MRNKTVAMAMKVAEGSRKWGSNIIKRTVIFFCFVPSVNVDRTTGRHRLAVGCMMS